MRMFLIPLLATLVLVAGCASNHTRSPGTAPSQEVQGGWSVPPGQQPALSAHVTPEQAQRAAQAAEQAKQEAARQAAIQAKQEAARKAAAQAKQEAAQRQAAAKAQREAEQRRAEARIEQPAVKPIVPAFPVRMQEARVPELRMVHFGFDTWNLTPRARAILDANATWLKANPQVDIQIGGYCDERGSPEYNLALGERRARTVRDYLIRHGVPAERLTAISFGEEVPLDPRHNPAAWAKNRRAEFHPGAARQASRTTPATPSS